MKSKICILLIGSLIWSALPSASALTAQERKIIQAAQAQIEQAMQNYTATKSALTDAQQQAADADAHAAKTDQAAGVLKKQVDDAYNQEKTLATENAKMKPVYYECTKWWSLGAFVYGAKEVVKHTLILALVGGVLVIGLLVLSFFFPLLVPILTGIFGAIESAIRSFFAIFKKK